MNVTSKRALLAGCFIASSVLATPALARHSHSGHHFGSVHSFHHHYARGSDRRLSGDHVERDRQEGADREAWAGRSAGRYQRVARHGRYQGWTAASSSSYRGAYSGSAVVEEARRYLGGNPTGWSRVWCGRFMNMVLERAGYRGTGSNLAMSFAHYGQHLSGPQVGALAVMGRRGGGHVGVVSAVLPNGDVKVVSGNHGHRVAESVYSRGRIVAFVLPTS